jgi:hypothetical protein
VIEFVFMLTHNDATVEHALSVVDEVSGSSLRYIGFKDVGVSEAVLREITTAAHEAGLEVMLEIVATDAEDELRSLRNARAIGVDWVLGGTQHDAGIAELQGTGIRYCPFPGIVEEHPSVLKGEVMQIAEHARTLTSTPGVHGVDLLAYRHRTADPLVLTRAVVDASAGPVIVAGSIATLEQIEQLDRTGAWGFTVGGAVFERRFPGGGSIRDQVETVLAAVDATPA